LIPEVMKNARTKTASKNSQKVLSAEQHHSEKILKHRKQVQSEVKQSFNQRCNANEERMK